MSAYLWSADRKIKEDQFQGPCLFLDDRDDDDYYSLPGIFRARGHSGMARLLIFIIITKYEDGLRRWRWEKTTVNLISEGMPRALD